MPTALAIGAAIGLAKSELIDRPAAERKRKLAAATQRYSPWTGMQAQAPDDPNDANAMLQYGATGAMMGSGMKTANANVAAQTASANADQAYADRLSQGGSPLAAAAPDGGYGGPYDPWGQQHALGTYQYKQYNPWGSGNGG